jgi:hypothetical protein
VYSSFLLTIIKVNVIGDVTTTWQNELRTNNREIMTLLFAEKQAVISKYEDSLQRALYMLSKIAVNSNFKILANKTKI